VSDAGGSTAGGDAAALDRSRDRARGLAFVLGGVLLYVILHTGFRMLASGVLGEDDTLEQVMVQELRVAYEARQPPLYDWVLYAVQQVTGPRLVAFLLVKYAALTATAVLIYLAAYRILGDRVWAALTVESLALIYQISWRYHEGFTHEVLAMVAVSATLVLFLRLYDHGRARDYFAFGIVAGLGFLTEPNYAVYQMCLWGAAALQPAIAARTVRPMLLLSAAVALAIASPYLVWLLGDATHRGELWRASARGALMDRAIGIKDALRGPVMYLLPLIAILPAVFPGYVQTAWRDVRALAASVVSAERGKPDSELFVLSTLLLGVVLPLLGGLVLGIGGYAMHVLMPLYVTSVVWLIAVARRSPRGGERQALFGKLALAIAVIALLARLANMFVLDPVCGKCRWGIPYAGLAAEMRAAGFDERGTILAIDDEVAGNLRQQFPQALIVLGGPRRFVPAGGVPRSGSLAVVWDATKPAAQVAAGLAGVAPMQPMLQPAALERARLVRVPWRHLWKPDGYRTSNWRVLVEQR
jgi:4-amino-4-deoxy-L-arabinose transferase-like glycosyltransferase